MLPEYLEKRRPKTPEIDVSTLSNYQAFDVEKCEIDLELDFACQKVVGKVLYTLTKIDDAVNVIELDTSELVIHKVEVDGVYEKCMIGPRQEPLGSKLVVKPDSVQKKFVLSIDFSTTERGNSVQWLHPKQTAGKPLLYNLSESIHARSFFPCFDTPAVKMPINATIKSPYKVLFTGIAQESKDKNVYKYHQPIPIPAYLVAIASGDIVEASLGPRSKVFAETSVLAEAVECYKDDMESYIEAAEKVATPYSWEFYGFFVCPSAYPYGGMEFPNVTFATPGVVTKDKSSNNVIMHELAHSWSGNLVTNANWNHFWLNEGWTVYLERRIIRELQGEDARQRASILGATDFKNTLLTLPPQDSVLVQSLTKEIDPDSVMNLTAYEKGYSLLYLIEKLVGGPDKFDPFVKFYFDKYQRKSITTWDFLDTIFEFYDDKRDVLESIDWESWLFASGIPKPVEFDTKLVQPIYDLANRWISKASSFNSIDEFKAEFSSTDIDSYETESMIIFLNVLLQSGDSSDDSIDWAKYPVAGKAFYELYDSKLSSVENGEIASRYIRFQLILGLESGTSRATEFVSTVGRIKFVRPVYIELNKVNKDLALETYKKYRDTYHPTCVKMVDADLKFKS